MNTVSTGNTGEFLNTVFRGNTKKEFERMSDRYVIEAWLRPAVELNSALVSGGAAFVCAVAPWAVALSPSVSYVTAGAFAGFSALRAHQGFRVLRYLSLIHI